MIRSEYRQWADEIARPKLTIAQRVAKWFERSQSQPVAVSNDRPDAPPSAPCDLCGTRMQIPDHCKTNGVVLGLLVCVPCIESQLETMSYEQARH